MTFVMQVEASTCWSIIGCNWVKWPTLQYKHTSLLLCNKTFKSHSLLRL